MESQSESMARKYIPSIVISPAPPQFPPPASTRSPSAPNTAIMAPKLPLGARKAKGMEVNISGFYGMHPIETGIAYWYRGHYMYSVAGIPVEPIPFATKKGVHIVGTTVETAPPVRTGRVPGDLYEPEVAALYKSMVHTWDEQAEEKEREKKKEVIGAGAFGAQTDKIEGLKSVDQEVNPPRGSRSAKRSQNHLQVEVVGDQVEGHYNDRAMFLAQSAPGSQRGTPTPSRSITPMPWASRAPSPAPFRTVASTSRMKTLLDQAPVIEGLLALQENHPELLNPLAVNTYLSTLNEAHFQSPSQALSRVPSGISMVELNRTLPTSSRPLSRVPSGLSEVDGKHKVTLGVSSRNASIHKDIPGPSMSDLVKARETTAGRISRIRSNSMKSASRALNAAFNDNYKEHDEARDKKTGGSILKCCVHGGDCDGVTVTNEHLTLQNRKTRGFKEEYPMMTKQDRTMIDWFALVKEEKNAGK